LNENPSKNIVEALESYKVFFDSAHDLIHIVEPEGKILYVNNSWTRLLGFSEEEIRGQSIYSLVDSEDRDRFVSYRENILKGHASNDHITIRLITKSAHKLYVEGFVYAEMAAGRALYTGGIFRDVTERQQNEAKLKRANEDLKLRESNLHLLLHYAPDAVIVITPESIIKYWNPKAEAIFGWASPEVLDRSLADLIIPEKHRVAHAAGMKRYLSTGKARVLNTSIEITALRKDGQEFYVSLTISTTYQEGQLAFVAFIRDIDEQKRNAIELEQKKMQLEISNQNLEQFAHVASHDMREPIRKILIFANLLESESNLLPDPQRYVLKIQRAASRLASMVDGVLAHSTLKASELIAEDVNLNEVIENIQDDLEVLFNEKNARLSKTNLPTIQGVTVLLHQLFYNLINNALKFSRPDINTEITVTANKASGYYLEQFAGNPDRSYVEIVVRDNGIGFDQAYSEQIFKTFTRLHSKDRYEGTGLGLSLCKTIVEKHQGFIKAFAKENEGATFVIILPEHQNIPPLGGVR
jgi:two-component system, LuxR family, sensor kinase FixL